MTAADEWLTVESLDLEAQGVAHNAEGKVALVALESKDYRRLAADPNLKHTRAMRTKRA